MKMLEKILFATDFSKSSEDAMQTVLSVAGKFNSQVILLHVTPLFSLSELQTEVVRKAVTEELQRVKERIAAAGLEVVMVERQGLPFVHIVQEAKVHDVNIIIVGSGNNQSDTCFTLGTTAERILQESTKPVWVVRRGTKFELTTILCPVDMSSAAKRALNNAIHLARQFSANLQIVHVIAPPAPVFRKLFADSVRKLVPERKEKFDAFLRDFDFHQILWNRIVLEGDTAEMLQGAIRDTEPDLLVMGSVGRDEPMGVRMGRIARKLVRQLPTSVLAMRSEEVIRLRFEQDISAPEEHLDRGAELLESGFTEEALSQFRYCIRQNSMCPPAYEGMATALERLGRMKEADAQSALAQETRQWLWARQVESDIRQQLFSSIK